MAETLEVDLQEDCDEYSLQLPAKVGEGSIRGIDFKAGLGLVIYDCIFAQDTRLCFTVSKVHPAKFIYCTEGSLEHSFESNQGERHTIDKFQTTIVASTAVNGHILHFKKGQRTKLCSLEVLRSKFVTKIKCELGDTQNNLKQMFEDVSATTLFYHQAYYSLNLHKIFNQIEKSHRTGLLQRLFLEGKAYDMLTRQIEQYSDDQHDSNHQNLLKRAEIEAVHKALHYIKNHLDKPLKVSDLCRETGLNPNKLQIGFRILENNTINGFIKAKRLETARTLLLNTDLSISEVVYKIGLLNRSYFTRIFKEAFGDTPTDFRNNFKS